MYYLYSLKVPPSRSRSSVYNTQSVTYVGCTFLVWGLWIGNEDTTFIYVLMEYVHYVIHRNEYIRLEI